MSRFILSSRRASLLFLTLYVVVLTLFQIYRTPAGPKLSYPDTNGTADEIRFGFCIHYDFVKARFSFSNSEVPVSLCSHATTNYLPAIARQINEWRAPISVSLLIGPETREALYEIRRAHVCDQDFGEMVSIHIVYSTSLLGTCSKLPNFEDKLFDCRQFNISNAFSYFRPPFGIYPINVMRNVARIGSLTELQFLADIEMTFSRNFEAQIRSVANEWMMQGNRTVFIIRRFEATVYPDPHIPKDILALRARFRQKTANFFHRFSFPEGHFIEEQGEWVNASIETQEIAVKPHRYRGGFWEPQPLLHKSAPLCYENVPTRLRDMQYCIYALCRAGYQFAVPTHVFNVHPGIRNTTSPLDTAIRNHQKPLGLASAEGFQKAMDLQYPNTGNLCGSFLTPFHLGPRSGPPPQIGGNWGPSI